MILRNFLYLNTESLTDYLSALEGYIVEGADVLESERSQYGGKAGITLAEGKASKEICKLVHELTSLHVRFGKIGSFPALILGS